MDKTLRFTYTNYRGETSEREVVPMHMWFGESKFHEGAQWFLKAFDVAKGTLRDFAMSDMKDIIRG